MAVMEEKDEKILALIQFLDMDEEKDYDRFKKGYSDNIYVIDDGKEIPSCYKNNEFLVCTDKEADKEHEEYIKNLMDDLGIEAFSPTAQEYIMENYAEWEDGKDYMREDYESYYEDIESEPASDDIFSDRLQEELFEKNVGDWRNNEEFNNYKTYKEEITDLEGYDDPEELAEALRGYMGLDSEDTIECIFSSNGSCVDVLINGESTNGGYGEYPSELMQFLSDPTNEGMEKAIKDYIEAEWENGLRDINDIREWFDNYDTNREDLTDNAVQSFIDEYDSPLEWAKFEFGKEFLEHLKKEGELEYDYKGIAEYCSEMDGRGNSLSFWDGTEYEEDVNGTTYYIYCDCDYEAIKDAEVEEEVERE